MIVFTFIILHREGGSFSNIAATLQTSSPIRFLNTQWNKSSLFVYLSGVTPKTRGKDDPFYDKSSTFQATKT